MKSPSDYSPAVRLLALCSIGGVEPRGVDLLLRHFGTIEAVLAAESDDLTRIDGISAALAAKVTAAYDNLDKAADLAQLLAEREIQIVTLFDPTYGSLLRELNDPPPLLFVRGKMPDPAVRSVTLVGTHEATADGIEFTTRIAQLFAEAGVQVISSLRGGIDGAAHLGARAVNGVSFAVIDGGFDAVADSDIMPLAIDIVEGGGVISEYLPDQPSNEITLEASNRLLVGLSQAVVVTEIYASSTHTRDLLEFCNMVGKMLFIVVDPTIGALVDEESLELAIENGAIPIEGYDHIDDIIRSLV